MDRRGFLSGAGASLAATLAGCLGGMSEGDKGSPGGDCRLRLERNENDSMKRYLEKNETPDNAGARDLLATVEDETDGLAIYTGPDNTDRVGFSEAGDTWELKYRGTPHAGEDRFQEEIAELATTFASKRPDGVSLVATSLHECTTGTWHVCAGTVAAYERGELDRQKFLDRVYESAEIVNNC